MSKYLSLAAADLVIHERIFNHLSHWRGSSIVWPTNHLTSYFSNSLYLRAELVGKSDFSDARFEIKISGLSALSNEIDRICLFLSEVLISGEIVAGEGFCFAIGGSLRLSDSKTIINGKSVIDSAILFDIVLIEESAGVEHENFSLEFASYSKKMLSIFRIREAIELFSTNDVRLCVGRYGATVYETPYVSDAPNLGDKVHFFDVHYCYSSECSRQADAAKKFVKSFCKHFKKGSKLACDLEFIVIDKPESRSFKDAWRIKGVSLEHIRFMYR